MYSTPLFLIFYTKYSKPNEGEDCAVTFLGNKPPPEPSLQKINELEERLSEMEERFDLVMKRIDEGSIQ